MCLNVIVECDKIERHEKKEVGELKERIQQLAQGIVQVEVPDLTFFPENLNKDVPVGAVISLEVMVKSRNKIPFKGFFYSTDERVKVCTPNAAGMTGSVSLEISTKTCEIRDVIAGSIWMVSNAGEKQLPFQFTVTGSDSFESWPKTLPDFAEYARTNSKKALRIFQSPHFVRMPFMEDPGIAAIYDGVRAGAREEQALEAFLVACRAKSAVTFSVDKIRETVELEVDENGRGELHLFTNTWGNVKIRVFTDMEWLKADKSVLTEADFTENESVIPYRIVSKSLHSGKNIGEILLRSDNQSISVFVQVNRKSKDSQQPRGKMPKEMTANLYQMLLEYLNGSYEEEVIRATMERTIENAAKKYPGEIGLHLLRGWLLVEAGKRKDARAIFDWCRDTIAQKRSEIPVVYCIFLYLDSRARNDQTVTETANKIIHKYYEAVPSRWIALLELMAVNKDHVTDEEMLEFLEEVHEAYGSSPFVYALAARIYRRNPALIGGNTMFPILVFHYMIKYDCCPDLLIERFLRQMAMVRSGSSLQLTLLQKLYQKKKNDQVLAAICSQLVRQGKTGEKYSHWYEEGIRREIHLTSLNDYYLASLQINENSSLPIDILLYYSYKNDLDDRTRQSLYSYILANYAPDSEMYRAYENQMNQFAISQLLSGTINAGLVRLYENVLSPGLVDRRLSRVLPDLLFSRQITTSLPYAVKLVVRYPQLRQEWSVQLENGVACVPVYTDNAAILFEDKYGNRYADPSCRSEQLMYQPELVEACRRQSPNQLMLLLEETCLLYHKPIQDDRMYEQVRQLLLNGELTSSYRHLLVCRMIDYCYACSQKTRRKEEPLSPAMEEEATQWLLSLDLQTVSGEMRTRVIELYIMRGCMKEAFLAVRQYGYSRIRLPLLLKMTVRYITESVYEYDEFMIHLGLFLLHKKQWNEVLLSYMSQYFNGTTDTMLQLLLLTQETKTENGDLSERVVAQMMFTGNWTRLNEAFAIYRQNGQVTELIQNAYFVLKCHEYLQGKEPMTRENIRVVEASVMKDTDNRLPKCYTFALLQYYSTLTVLEDKQKYLCERLVYGLCAKEIYLGCFHALGRHIEMPHQMEGKVIAQRIGLSGGQVWMEGTLYPQNRPVSEQLREIYPGIYTAAFFLFTGETMELTLYHDDGVGTVQGDSVTLSAGSCYARKDSLYDQLCRLIVLNQDGELEELKRHCAQTERQKRVVTDLFTLM